MRIFNSLIIPIALYSSETWSIKSDDDRRISAFETKCLRCVAGITDTDRLSNEDLRKLLRCPRTIMDRVSQQLHWLGHIQRISANQLPKITFEGRVHGTCPRGRPHKRLTDSFPANNLPQLLRLAPDRSNYRRYIHHLSRREEAVASSLRFFSSLDLRPDGTSVKSMSSRTLLRFSFFFLKAHACWFSPRESFKLIFILEKPV